MKKIVVELLLGTMAGKVRVKALKVTNSAHQASSWTGSSSAYRNARKVCLIGGLPREGDVQVV